MTFILEALKQASIALDKDEIPVGAVLVDPKTKKIIAKSYNKTRTDNDPLSHAEVNVIRKACKELKTSRLDGYDLYSTLEPCAMCAAAISLARIRNLYFASDDKKFGAVVSNINYFQTKACHHRPKWYNGFEEEKSQTLLKDFFKARRNRDK
jgi:tRNA(Arg) A34 adenosine deaminase TadA